MSREIAIVEAIGLQEIWIESSGDPPTVPVAERLAVPQEAFARLEEMGYGPYKIILNARDEPVWLIDFHGRFVVPLGEHEPDEPRPTTVADCAHRFIIMSETSPAILFAVTEPARDCS